MRKPKVVRYTAIEQDNASGFYQWMIIKNDEPVARIIKSVLNSDTIDELIRTIRNDAGNGNKVRIKFIPRDRFSRDYLKNISRVTINVDDSQVIEESQS